MNMSQAIKLEPCTLLDELVIERDVLLRDLHKQTGDRAVITRIAIRDLTDKIQALETVR